MSKSILSTLLVAWIASLTLPAWAAERPVPADSRGAGYVARDESLRGFFDALAAQLKKPVVISKLAARKQISGEFDLSNAQAMLDKLSQQLGLIWYHDGQAIYVYDASEIRNAVVSLRNVSLNDFIEFLRSSGLYDKRYSPRGDGHSGTFYVSGPPIFVDLVVDAASFMDKQSGGAELGRQKISVVHLNNTFVNDRSYELRDQKIIIPGIATVISRLLAGEEKPLQRTPGAESPADQARSGGIPQMPDFPGLLGSTRTNDSSDTKAPGLSSMRNVFGASHEDDAPASDVKVIAYPDTNSLLVKGTAEQVRFIEKLANALDQAKRHVELSLWIIDMDKQDLDQLGVNWSGSFSIANKFGAAFNKTGSVSMLDGARFIASVMALAQDDRANVVSRPVVLTQENVPAHFDNSRTFYAKLVGERATSLEHVTYGTLVSVLPRFSADDQIEMELNIEDGSQTPATNDGASDNSPDALPEVGRTSISTVARVPQGKSLLIGGYTRDANSDRVSRIPLLGSLPLVGGLFRYRNQSKTNTVRVFLIQPREIVDPVPDAADLASIVISPDKVGDDSVQSKVRAYMNRKAVQEDAGTPAVETPAASETRPVDGPRPIGETGLTPHGNEGARGN